MAILKVQATEDDTFSAGATKTLTLGGNTTPGNTAVVLVGYANGSIVAINSVAGGGTWTAVGAQFNDAFGDGSGTQAWICKNLTGATTTITITMASSVNGIRARYAEFSGCDTTTQPDNSFTTNGQQLVTAATDAITAAATTTLTNNAAVIGWTTLSGAGAVTQVNAGTGYTALNGDPSPDIHGDFEFKTQAVAGSATPTFTPTGNGGDWVTWAFALRPASGSAPVIAWVT